MSRSPILVTGAAGRLGGVDGEVVDILRSKGLPVRALVRTDDDRAEALRATGAQVLVGDLTRAENVARALDGCRRLYFGMSVSAPYLEATVTAAAVARELGGLEVFVNISELTVSQMSLLAMTDSPQQRMHWLGEQALNWSGLPEHVAGHLKTMAQLHADNRYDRLTRDFEAIIGRPATSIREYVAKHPELFGSSKPVRVSP